MKKEVVGKVLLISFLFVFLLSGVLAVSSGSCDIVARSECTGDSTNGYVVMGLSSETNAHGELATQSNYDSVLCCNIGTGNTDCSGTNKIIGLFSETNSHAEVPSEENYNENVCYENLVCTHRSSCNEGEAEVLSLSDVTNAHIGGAGDYNVKICCSGVGAGFGDCSLLSAKWNLEEATDGQKVYLEVTGSSNFCDGRSISFEVYEEDLLGDDTLIASSPEVCPDPKKPDLCKASFVGDTSTGGVWYAEWVDDGILGGNPEYYFTVTLGEDSIKSNNPTLKVLPQDSDYCIVPPITACGNYETESECESDSCDVVGESSLPGVECDDDNTECACAWDEDAEGTEEDPKCKFGYIELSEDECGTPSEGCNYGCTLCYDLTTEENYCNLGSTCPAGETPGDNDGTCESGIDGCSSEDCSDGDRDSCASPYYCSGGKCLSIEGPSITAISGTCEVTQIVESNCDEDPVGYKTLRVTGTWKGDECGDACIKCESMNNEILTVPCPAQIQLPFFGWQSAVIIIVVIIIIYIIWKYKKKEVKRKTPSKTKSKRKKRKTSKKK